MAAEKSSTFSLSFEDEEEFARVDSEPKGKRRPPLPVPRSEAASSQPFELDLADLGWPSSPRADRPRSRDTAPRISLLTEEVAVVPSSESIETSGPLEEVAFPQVGSPSSSEKGGAGSEGAANASSNGSDPTGAAFASSWPKRDTDPAAIDLPLDFSELEYGGPAPAHSAAIPTLDEAGARLMGSLPRLLEGASHRLRAARNAVATRVLSLLSERITQRKETKAQRSVRSGPSLGQRLRELASSLGPWLLTVMVAIVVGGLVNRAFDAEGRFVLFGGPVPDLGSLEDSAANRTPDQQGTGKALDAPAPSLTTPLVETAALPPGIGYPGKGLLEVVTTEDELIYADGVFMGRGPLRRLPVSPGEHVVTIRTGPTERTATIQVERGKSTRVAFLEAAVP